MHTAFDYISLIFFPKVQYIFVESGKRVIKTGLGVNVANSE